MKSKSNVVFWGNYHYYPWLYKSVKQNNHLYCFYIFVNEYNIQVSETLSVEEFGQLMGGN